jgi:hypothetical protein
VTARVIRLAEAVARPWRNGGGTTRELLAWPSEQAWRLRVSVADVSRDGPFSSFPGVERWFAVLDGSGVELAIGGQSHRLTADAPPFRFSGEATTTCRLLDGPTRDLNLMLRGMRGGMFACVAGEPWRPRSAQCGLFAAVAGRCRGEVAIDVPARSLLWFEAAPPVLSFEAAEAGAAAGWWLAATPMEHSAWA